MSGCGLIGRCDTGGLAAISREIHRHLHPTRTLLLDLEEQGRGDCTPDEYLHGDVYRTTFKGGVSDLAVDWLTGAGIDTLLSIETWYRPDLPLHAHRQGIRTVMYAMPELAAWAYAARQTFVPTAWRADTVLNAQLLPFPVARDRLPYTERKRVEHLFHMTGTAMLDRNGTQLLLDALPFLTTDVRVTIRSERPVNVPACRADVEVVPAAAVDYWDAYPSDADLLVLPRRYGGLSLPIAECASLGIPALCLQSDPYAAEPFVTSVPSTGFTEERMKGGRVPVHGADPRALANAIDWLVQHPEAHQDASHAADRWAAQHDWDGPLGDRWHVLFANGP